MEKYAVGNIFKNRYNTKYEIIEKLNNITAGNGK